MRAALAAAALATLLAAGLAFAVRAQALPSFAAGNAAAGAGDNAATGQGQAQPGSADIAASIANQQVALEQARSDLAVLDLSIASAQQYLDRSRLNLADANQRLEIAEDRYNQSLQIFNGRLAQIYKLGEGEDYAVLLSSNDFGDAMSRISYLATISENDHKLVNQVQEQAQLVQSLQQQIDDIKQSQAHGFDQLIKQRQQLLARIDLGVRNIDAAQVQLAQAQAREQAAEASRLAQEAANAGSYAPGGMADGQPIVLGDSKPDGLRASGVILRGVASWYGPGFNGQHTADGENYDMFAYTAASKTLPFGTWLKVTFNNRSVFVRVNDRGPYIGDRILDLSYASAQAIGLTGIGYVTAEIYN